MFRLNLWTRPFLHPSGAPGTENTSYLPNPLASPALMVLASSAEQGREGAHLPAGHPLASAGQPGGGDKDSPVIPFSAASFPFFRPGEHIPPPLYSHLHQPFLRPHLDPAAFGLISPRGGGAFHPLAGGGGDDRDSLYPSAFMPTKKLKLDHDSHDRGMDLRDADEKSLRAESEGSRGRPSPFSPGERHSSPALSRVDSPLDLHSDAGDRNSPEGSVKGLHKWYSADGLCCPICKAILQPGEIQSHLAKEVADLHHLFARNKISATGDAPSVSDRERSDFLFSVNGTREVSSKSRYETFMRIKTNREARLARLRGRRKRLHDESMANSSGDSELLNGSTERPIEKDAEEETIDVIGYEESDKDARPGQSEKPREGQTDSERLKAESTEENGNTIHAKERVKCSVCASPYTSPVTSVQCWHVHCEKCWLESLNNKKLCPQCNIVTSHADLRRIYI